MLSLLAMLFTFRMGLGAAPVDGALASLREQAVAVATERAAARERAEEVAPPVPHAFVAQEWSAPPRYALTRERWRHLLTDALSNETVAGAAMWLLSQPVHVRANGQKFFVSLRFPLD